MGNASPSDGNSSIIHTSGVLILKSKIIVPAADTQLFCVMFDVLKRD